MRRCKGAMRAVIGLAVLALLLTQTHGQCQLEYNPSSRECQNYAFIDAVAVCSENIAALRHGRDSTGKCVLGVISDGEVSVGDTVSVFAVSKEHIPLCLKMTRSGTASGKAGTMGDLGLALQVDSFSEGQDFYSAYHSYEDLVLRWKAMVSRGGASVRMETIGYSFQGRELHMLRIGSTNLQEPKRVIFTAQQHAREWAAGMVVTYIADVLVDVLTDTDKAGDESSFANRGLLKAILKEVEVLIVPVINPDGYIYTKESRFHRKNMRTIPGSNCIGVDLNRNWGKDWKGLESTSSDPCMDIYVGTSAFSEPETAAIKRVVEAEANKGMIGHIDYHAYGGMVLGPWSFEGKNEPPNGSDWMVFGEAIADGVKSVSGTVYRYGLGTDNILPYSASGVASDWTFFKGITSATIEVHPVVPEGSPGFGFDGFVLDSDLLRIACTENFAGVTGLLRWAAPDAKAQVENSTTGGVGGSASGSGDASGSGTNSDSDKNGLTGDSNGGLSKTALIGIYVGAGLLGLLLIAVVGGVLYTRRNRRSEDLLRA